MPRNWTVVTLAASLAACAGGERRASAQGTVLEGELARALDARLASVPELAGAFLVARGGEIVFAQGYGQANRATGQRWTPETVSDIGSLTKGVTGAAIVKLQEQGRLAVTDTLGAYFDGLPADKRAITLHQLLTHTAGLVESTGSDAVAISRDSAMALAMGSRLRSQPGTSHRYSNTGYTVLAAVVEKASGLPYERYVQEQLFAPAGVRETGYRAPRWPGDRLAHGYRPDGSDWGTPLDQPWRPDGPGWHLRGNGGMLSTARDLYRWLTALQGDAVLNAASRRQLFAPHVSEQPGSNLFYGYGWAVVETPQGRRIWHNGGNPFFYAEYVLVPGQNVVAIALTNAEGPAFRSAWSAVQQAARTGVLPEAPEGVAVPAAVLQRYVGEYRIPGGPTATVRLNGGGLTLTSGAESAEMIATAENRFTVPSLGLTAEFVRDASGRVSGMRVEQGGGTFNAARVDAEPAPAGGAVSLPDTPAGRRVRQFLNVMRSDDDAARHFVEEAFTPQFLGDAPLATHLGQLRLMRGALKNAEVISYQGSASSAVVRLRSTEAGAVYTATFAFEGADARIAELGVTR